jgi:hypothetical protein
MDMLSFFIQTEHFNVGSMCSTNNIPVEISVLLGVSQHASDEESLTHDNLPAGKCPTKLG